MTTQDERPGALGIGEEMPSLSLHGERPVSLGVHDERPGRLSLHGERLGLRHVDETGQPPESQAAALLGVYFLGVLTGAAGLLLLQVGPVSWRPLAASDGARLLPGVARLPRPRPPLPLLPPRHGLHAPQVCSSCWS